MKFKQSNPKSVRPSAASPLSSTASLTRHRVRCSLCDSLLKASSTHRYFLLGKSVHDQLDGSLTYGQCCQQYLNENYSLERFHMLCPKCCQHLHELYSLYKNASELTNQIRQTWSKTKRVNRTRHLRVNHGRVGENPLSSSSSSSLAASPVNLSTEHRPLAIKEETDHEEMPMNLKTSKEPEPFSISATIPSDLSSNPRTPLSAFPIQLPHQMAKGFKGKPRTPKPPTIYPPKARKSHFMPTSRPAASNEQQLYPNNFSYQSTNDSQANIPYAQLMIDTPSPSSSSSNQPQNEEQRENSARTEPVMFTTSYGQVQDGERSVSPHTNDDDAASVNGSKAARLSRRQYDFLVKLPDQQSLNTFIETSSAESGSRWTWRRTSANSRGYKVYYVCNFSMRRHYHPCPAAMYALFHPEESISIYACGEHQHIPKDRLPVSITEATKDEIFKCLQGGMSTTDIREHLTRLQLPFGDTRKLNNFIKYHKELLRFGTVTNVRIGGTAYRQPQCWAIRRQPPTMPNSNNESASSPTAAAADAAEQMPAPSDNQ